MSSLPTISGIEKEIYGEFYWSNPAPTQQELRESERNEHGLIAFLFLPIYDPSLRFAFTIPTKWFDTDNYMYFPPLHEILETHYETIIAKMSTKKAKNSYKNPKYYTMLIDYIQKWKLNQNCAANTTLAVQELPSIANQITDTFSTGQLVLLNGSKLSFAKKHPIAQVKRTNESKSQLEIILMHKNDDDTIEPLANSSTYVVNFSDVCRILSNESDQISMQLAYFKLKCKNQKLKQKSKDISRIKTVMHEYLGKKVVSALNVTNFNKFRRLQKDTEVEQEVNSKDADVYKDYLQQQKIKFTHCASYLRISIQSPAQLGSIIGSRNVMSIRKGYEYFAQYPLVLKYGYKLKYPKFKIKINVLRKNAAGNIEK